SALTTAGGARFRRVLPLRSRTVAEAVANDELTAPPGKAPPRFRAPQLVGVDHAARHAARPVGEQQVLPSPRAVRADHVDDRRAAEVETAGRGFHHPADAVVALERSPEYLVDRVGREQGHAAFD